MPSWEQVVAGLRTGLDVAEVAWVLRVPLVAALAMLAAPWLLRGNTFTRNLFELPHGDQARRVATMAVLAGATVGHVFSSTLAVWAPRVAGPAWQGALVDAMAHDATRLAITVGAALILPIPLVVEVPDVRGRGHALQAVGGTIGGLLVAVALTWTPALIRGGGRSSFDALHADSAAFAAAITAMWLVGYAWTRPVEDVRETWRVPAAVVVWLLGVLAFVHWVHGEPTALGAPFVGLAIWGVITWRDDRARVPALLYVLQLGVLATLWIGGAAARVGPWGLPSLTLFLGVAGLAALTGRLDHVFRVHAPTKELPTLEEALHVRVGAHRDVVVIAAHGGGIQAAAWTAEVVTGLDALTAGAFTERLAVVSGVSGGSVGLLHVLDHFQGGALDATAHGAVRANASEPSLDHASWGWVYPDLMRFLMLWPWFPWLLQGVAERRFDRGWSLEKAWLRTMRHRRPSAVPAPPGGWKPEHGEEEQLLSDWGVAAAAGQLPVVVFNATVAETGARMPLANVELALGGPAWEPRDDLEVVTAARMSATFPWISPQARGARAGGSTTGFRLCDGGYFDNSGVTTLVQVLQQAAGLLPRGGTVHLVELDGFPAVARPDEAMPGWQAETIGALVTLAGARTQGFVERNPMLVDGLRDQLAKVGVQVEHHLLKFPDGYGDPPMSWQMSADEIGKVASAWTALAAGPAVGALVGALTPPGTAPAAPAVRSSPTASARTTATAPPVPPVP